MGFSPDGKTLYVADTEGARLWAFDVEGPGVLRKPSGHATPQRSLKTSPAPESLNAIPGLD